ncbi:MAG: hypothetical protein SV186_04915 [Candidatus Nanohaloarchaea archaeon]|nr:hypothetical protein [Candidatus Nanohaloarchaea archaeon]
MDRGFAGNLLLLVGGVVIIGASIVGYTGTQVSDLTGRCTVDLPVLDIEDNCRNVETVRYVAIGSGVVGLLFVLVPLLYQLRERGGS